MKKSNFWRHATLCALVGGAALSFAPSAHAQFSKISEREEIEAGRQASAQAQKQYGRALPQSDPRQQRVTRIGAMFARQASRRSIPYSYTVLQNDKVLNAFAAPGGPIFVTTKLISTASNDAELAFVLGHETGHIEHKDVVRSVEKQQKVGLGVGILGAILGGGKGGGNLVGTITGVGYTLWQKGYSRDQESEADEYGVHAMARLGFDPRAAASMLGKLGDAGGGIGKYLSDHPTSSSRVKAVGEMIRKDNLLQVAQNGGGAFLMLSGASSAGYGNYQPTNDRYPTEAYANQNGNASNAYPSDNGAQNTISVEVVSRGKYRVAMAAVTDIARYAGGQAQQRGNDILVSRGNSYAVFSPGSTTANVNGRRVSISAPLTQIGGRVYAPIGTLAEALGGSATYDPNRRGIRLEFDGGPRTFLNL